METRSNHILVGGVVLALIAAVLLFTVWLARISGGDAREYDIFFKQSVDGLAKGSGVTFSGVPVGQVQEILLWKKDPEFVRVRISLRGDVPILQGTTATIAGVGFTGVSQVNLDGAVKGAPPIVEPGPAGAPVIPTKPGALGELLNSAPLLLERFSALTERLTELLDDENQKSITGILANVDRLSGALADRAPDIAATLAETRVAIKQAGDAAEQIGKLAESTDGVVRQDLKPMMANLDRTALAARKSMENLDAAISDARPGIKAFSTRTLPEAGLLIRDLRDMADALTAVAGRLDRGGATGLIGAQQLPDYEPAK